MEYAKEATKLNERVGEDWKEQYRWWEKSKEKIRMTTVFPMKGGDVEKSIFIRVETKQNKFRWGGSVNIMMIK
jgi:hypothetical protein